MKSNGSVPRWRYLEAAGIVAGIIAAVATLYFIQQQANSLAKQTEYITRPAELHLVLDFYKERGGNEPPEIRNPINLSIVNTGAQLGVVNRVVVNYTEVDQMVDGVPNRYSGEDAVSFPMKIIPPGGWVTQPTRLHEPVVLNDTGRFKTAIGRHQVQYTMRLVKNKPALSIPETD